MVELHLRLTTNLFTLTQVEDFIKTLSPDKYIVAQEVVPYNHYHCHFVYECSNFTSYQKRKLGKIVVDTFNLTDGNKHYGISADRGKSAIYTVKDGKFVFKGYTEAEITTLYAQSNTKLDFKHTLKNIYDLVMTNEITYYQYCEQYITAHCDAMKPISNFRVEAHFKTICLVKKPWQISTYAKRMARHAEECDPYLEY